MATTDGGALFTLVELAAALQLPESTVRRHARRYADFLPTIGHGRERRYTTGARAILAYVAEQTRRKLPPSEIRRELGTRYPIELESLPRLPAPLPLSALTAPDAILEQLTHQAAALEQAHQELATVHEQLLTQLAARTTEAITFARENGQLRAEREQLQVQLEALTQELEALHQARTPAPPPVPWWRRWWEQLRGQ